MHAWASPFSGFQSASSLWVDVLVYKYSALIQSQDKAFILWNPGPLGWDAAAGCVSWYTDQVGYVLVLMVVGWGCLIQMPVKPSIRVLRPRSTLLGSQGVIPEGSYLLWQGLVYHLVPEAPLFMRMSLGLRAFLEQLGMCGQQPWARFPL